MFLILSLAIVSSGCQKETEEGRIKNVIAAIQSSVEQKDIKGIIGNISKAYTDPQGNDYNTVKTLLLGYFYQHPKISASIINLEIIIDNISAKVTFQAILTGGNKEGSIVDIVPQSLGMYAFDLSFRKENKEWKVLSAKWEQVGN